MNVQMLKDIVSGSLNKTLSFPQIVKLLQEDGIESYRVDIVLSETRYYHKSGETFVAKFPHPFEKPALEFSAEKVKEAITKSQAGRITYRQFMHDIVQAGCVYYIVYIDGKNVAYMGRKGETHVEPIS